MIQRVLAAVDATPRAARVVESASDLAHQYGAELVLFRAIDVPPDLPAAAATQPNRIEPEILRMEEESLRAFAAMCKVKATTRVVASHEPWRAIVEAADAMKADAIVIGSHGYHGLDRLLGTNASRVADRAHCLVVVVHEPRAK